MNTAVLAQELQAAGAERVEVLFNQQTHRLDVEVESASLVLVGTVLGEYLAPFWPYMVRRHGFTKLDRHRARVRWTVTIIPEG